MLGILLNEQIISELNPLDDNMMNVLVSYWKCKKHLHHGNVFKMRVNFLKEKLLCLSGTAVGCTASYFVKTI